MLKLGGFAVSNYYNKVKVALLEKGIPFEEAFSMTSQEEEYRKRSPMGKVPYLEVDGRFLCESQVICEYLEEHYPSHPLYPKDLFERAKVRELINIMELNMELVARRLYAQAFFGGEPVGDVAHHRKHRRRSFVVVERDAGWQRENRSRLHHHHGARRRRRRRGEDRRD